MTPLQKLRLTLVALMCPLLSVLTIEYFRDHDGGFPTFLPMFVVVALLGYGLWHEVRTTRSQTPGDAHGDASDRRFVVILSVALIGFLVVVLTLLLVVQDL